MGHTVPQLSVNHYFWHLLRSINFFSKVHLQWEKAICDEQPPPPSSALYMGMTDMETHTCTLLTL